MKQRLKRQGMPFTQVPDCVLNDADLSSKAKGLFTYMYGKPPNWDFSIERIQNDHKDQRDAVASGLKELEDLGYLDRKKHGDGTVTYRLRYDKEVPFDSLSEANMGKSNSGDGKANSGKSQKGKILNISNNVNTVISSLDKFNNLSKGKKVNKGIHWFEEVNPAVERIYGHQVQRESMEWLLEKYDPEKLKTFITQVLPDLNGKQYFPTVTTPNQMVKKLSKIQAYFQKKQDEKESQGKEITGLNKVS